MRAAACDIKACNGSYRDPVIAVQARREDAMYIGIGTLLLLVILIALLT
jgi:hypothetical protein